MEKKPQLKDHNQTQFLLKEEINRLQEELDYIVQKTTEFEAILRSHLIEELIEVQELRVLYKKQKQAKKEKRLEQKKKGKNYKEPVEVSKDIKTQNKPKNFDEQKEIKRLYREAMLHVHPDKFSMEEEKLDLATETTSKLIDIYKSGNLLELKLYHRHITSGNAMNSLPDSNASESSVQYDFYLKREKEKLENQLIDAKNKRSYIVLCEYPDPLLFIDELKIFYLDKITKLRKRTRVNKVKTNTNY